MAVPGTSDSSAPQKDENAILSGSVDLDGAGKPALQPASLEKIGDWRDSNGQENESPDQLRDEPLELPDEAANILLVDDRPENLAALEAALDELNQNLIRAGSGKEALRAALERDFAVILLDVRLPEMDGFEAARLLRSRDNSKHTPIIFVTAIDTGDSQVSKGYSLGAVDYIFKPVDPDILRAKVRVFIDLYQKSREIEKLNASLERRVHQRTAELEAANLELEREVTVRKRAENEIRALNAELEDRVRARTTELEAVNSDLRAFTYSVSHDLRAPLRKIQAFSEMLLEESGEALNSTAADFLRRIQDSSRHMNALIEDMLKLFRITQEQMTRRTVNLSKMAQEITEELKSADPNRTVTLRIEENLLAEADGSLIRIALDNLLSNAWKFTSLEKVGLVEFASTTLDGAPAFVIRDNGAGFEMEFAEKIFEPFQRLHPSSAFPGTGVGLAIVRRIIERHGGRIVANAKEGKGSEFIFTLGAG